MLPLESKGHNTSPNRPRGVSFAIDIGWDVCWGIVQMLLVVWDSCHGIIQFKSHIQPQLSSNIMFAYMASKA